MTNEILTLLKQELPQLFATIQKAKAENNHDQFLYWLHYLHGAICYCKLPSLQQTIASLEKAVKQKQTEKMIILYADFEQKISELLCNE